LNTLDPKHLVLLDRDGVINEDSDAYIKSADEWLPVPGSLETIAKLNQHNIAIVVITNQSGIGRGLFSEQTLMAIHDKMNKSLELMGARVDDIFYCPHSPEQNCACRKPKSGLLDALEKKYALSVKDVPFIGDTDKDLALARSKGCLPVLVKTGKGEAYFNLHKDALADCLVFDNLQQAGDYLLNNYFNMKK
jgi:D-glycero-D-manno-heptose 1,7-bisphosphate phosphatase